MTAPESPEVLDAASVGSPIAGVVGTDAGSKTDRRHILTVSVEEFFHGGALADVVLRKHWDRFESRLGKNLDTVLECLDRHGQKATFFVLGWTAERNPELVRNIVSAGHEVASRGYWPRGVDGMMPEEFEEDLKRTRDILESTGGQKIVGFRSPRWLRRDDLWTLDVLAREGYLYDASVNPVLRWFAGMPEFHALREHSVASGESLWEVPVSTRSLLGWRVAISGGNYTRQLPEWLLSGSVKRWHERRAEPLVFYFNTWEFDPEQPQITAVGFLNSIRQYRNLGKVRRVLEGYFGEYSFTSVADYLGVSLKSTSASEAQSAETPIEVRSEEPETKVVPITVVVPMHNEEQNVSYLLKTLRGVQDRLEERVDLRMVLVDDASNDNTWEILQSECAGRDNVQAIRHESNQGVAGAIMTGIRAADTEFVVSIDCDCSYDPNDIEHMLPLMANADMVTASPYHRDGQVLNVPGWRLFLSKGLSRLYRWILGTDIATYTSCFRMYRRSTVAELELDDGGFLGVAEFLLRVHRNGGRIAEYPTMLERRLLGESKMRTLRTIRGHLGLLYKVLRKKI